MGYSIEYFETAAAAESWLQRCSWLHKIGVWCAGDPRFESAIHDHCLMNGLDLTEYKRRFQACAVFTH